MLRKAEENIWLELNLESGRIERVVLKEIDWPVQHDSGLSEHDLSTLRFVVDYLRKSDRSLEDARSLVEFAFSRLEIATNQDLDAESVKSAERQGETAFKSLREVAYHAIRTELESDGKVDLDSMTDKIMKQYPGRLTRNKASVRASVSSVMSALRNCYGSSSGIDAWTESIWRGKKSGRNPHITVSSDFEMPSYHDIWQSYKSYLKTRRSREK